MNKYFECLLGAPALGESIIYLRVRNKTLQNEYVNGIMIIFYKGQIQRVIMLIIIEMYMVLNCA